MIIHFHKSILFIVVLLASSNIFSCNFESSPIAPELDSVKELCRFGSGYYVASIEFDSKGGAWIGTLRQGLLHFSGNNLKQLYDGYPEIINQSLYSIAIDQDDNIWIGGNGLLKFDGKTFTRFDKTNSPLPENLIPSVACDKDNCLWISSMVFMNGGIARKYDRFWDVYTPKNSPLQYSSVWDIEVNDKNEKWIAISEYVRRPLVMKISNGEWTVYDSTDFGFKPFYFRDISVNGDDAAVLIDYSLGSGNYKNDPDIILFRSNRWRAMKVSGSDSQKLGMIDPIFLDNRGNIWAGVHNNQNRIYLAVYDGQSWITNPGNIPLTDITCIAQDNFNRIWLGTTSGIIVLSY